MHVITARNVNDAWREACALMDAYGIQGNSRNGKVYRPIYPVTTHYSRPQERVLWDVKRDANPFFHFFESLWILAGRADVEFLQYLNSNIANYSDDGRTFHGAYGYRLRHTHGPGGGIDQLDHAIELLRRNPEDRRVVCSIWDTALDLGANSKDIPCNDMLKFRVDDGRLGLLVFNRSNDIKWGCYGANMVQFSMLLEYVAGCAQLGVGELWQISSDWHYYGEQRPERVVHESDPYAWGHIKPYSLFTGNPDHQLWDTALRQFFRYVEGRYNLPRGAVEPEDVPFFTEVAVPLWHAWEAFKRTHLDGTPKERDMNLALAHVDLCAAEDWKAACKAWLGRRKD